MKPGNLVRSSKSNHIGIVVDIFDDLDPADPWIRVLFTHPTYSSQWCKKSVLVIIKKEEGGSVGPPLPDALSRSGSL